jgi:hypothetical protein
LLSLGNTRKLQSKSLKRQPFCHRFFLEGIHKFQVLENLERQLKEAGVDLQRQVPLRHLLLTSAIYKKHGEDKLCASTAAPCNGRKNMLISSSATAKLPGIVHAGIC